jgi:signal transduction histidine kinase
LRSRRIFYLQIAFFLFTFCVGILILLKFTADIKKSSTELSWKISEKSTALMAKFKKNNFSRPPDGDPQVLSLMDKKEGPFYVSAIGLFFGRKPVWVLPKDASLPAFSEPARGFTDIVVLSGSRRLFLSRVEDGPTLAILFETPRYRSEWRQTVAISTVLAMLVIFGMVLVSYTIRRFGLYYMESESVPPMKNDLGTFDAVVIMKKTVSELREKTRELEGKLGREKLRAKGAAAVLESLSAGLSAGFLRFDIEGKLQGLNSTANRLLGLPTLLRIGDSYQKLFAEKPRLKGLADDAVSQKTLLAAEEVEGFQGKLLLVLAIPVLDELNHFEGVLLIIHDRSEYYAMARIIREKETLSRLGEVAAGVAHEIRNGLNVLSGELRLLKQEPEGTAEVRIKRIETEIGQMERVVRDLLYFAKPLSLQKDPVPLRDFAGELIRSVESLYPDIVFNSEIAGDEFTADQDSVYRALMNIILNAAEAAGKGGEVFIKAFANENETVFHIEDSGEGVSGEAEKDLFSLFATHKKGGTGLGLPISRKIAREHGGELYFLKSDRLTGACFEFRIPK